jgi:hypothetical protein
LGGGAGTRSPTIRALANAPGLPSSNRGLDTGIILFARQAEPLIFDRIARLARIFNPHQIEKIRRIRDG